MTQNSDYFGNNIQGSPITNAATADECQYACYMRTNCRAYTFTITGYCYFKSAATNLVANAGFVTGAKTTGEHPHLHTKNLVCTGQKIS